MEFAKEFPDLQYNAPSKAAEAGFARSSCSWRMGAGAGAPLPGSSCAYSHLAPHLIYALSDCLDSDPLHEGAHLSGEIRLSVLVAKLAFSQILFLIFCTQQCQPSL